MSDKSDRVFTAGDVKEIAGLSYRQINDWDSRGSLPHVRDSEGGWRRFSPHDIFVLTVIQEIRKKFGIPIAKLQWVRDLMLQEGADHYGAAAELMALLGVGVWLVTDCEETFFVDSELELIDLAKHGYFGGDEDRAFVMLKLNPLVNKLLGCLKDPIHLPAHGRGYEILRAIDEEVRVRDEAEQRVLQIVREGDSRSVEISIVDGEIRAIKATESQPPETRIRDLLDEHEFQQIVITQRNGQVEAISQHLTERFDGSDVDSRIEKEEPADAD